MSDANRSSLNRAAALIRVAMVGGAAVSAPARAKRLANYLDRVDPDHTLTEDERQRRAHALLRADMTRLSARSVAARQSRSKATELRTLAAEISAAADEIESADGAA